MVGGEERRLRRDLRTVISTFTVVAHLTGVLQPCDFALWNPITNVDYPYGVFGGALEMSFYGFAFLWSVAATFWTSGCALIIPWDVFKIIALPPPPEDEWDAMMRAQLGEPKMGAPGFWTAAQPAEDQLTAEDRAILDGDSAPAQTAAPPGENAVAILGLGILGIAAAAYFSGSLDFLFEP